MSMVNVEQKAINELRDKLQKGKDFEVKYKKLISYLADIPMMILVPHIKNFKEDGDILMDMLKEVEVEKVENMLKNLDNEH